MGSHWMVSRGVTSVSCPQPRASTELRGPYQQCSCKAPTQRFHVQLLPSFWAFSLHKTLATGMKNCQTGSRRAGIQGACNLIYWKSQSRKGKGLGQATPSSAVGFHYTFSSNQPSFSEAFRSQIHHKQKL